VVFQSLTGLVLLFADPIEHWTHPGLTRHGAGDKGAAAALAAVRARYPDEDIGALSTPEVSDGVYVVEVGEHEDGGSGAGPRSVYVDPAGPRINGSLDHDAGIVALTRRLHRRLLFDSIFGLPGARLVAGLGLAWLALVVTGLGSAAWARFGSWWRRDPPTLHRTIGAVVAVPLVLVIVTGIRLAVPAGTDRIWGAVTGSGQGRPDVPPPGVRITSEDRSGEPLDATRALAAIQRRYPDGRIARLLMPRPGDRAAPVIAGVSVGFDPGRAEHDYGGNTVVFADQFTADTLWAGRPDSLPAARQAALLWTQPLHTGAAAGEVGRLLWGWLAVSVVLLAALGWITHRRRTHEGGRTRLHRAPPRRRLQRRVPRNRRRLKRRRALARSRRARAARTARAGRQRRRVSRHLRRRRKIQARTRARLEYVADALRELGGADDVGDLPTPWPEAAPTPAGPVFEIDLTDAVEIDLRDRADVEPPR